MAYQDDVTCPLSNHSEALYSGCVPQRNRLNLVELNLPLQNLLNLTLVWTLLHLLTANQVQELGRQDEVTLNSLRSNKNKSQCVAPLL